MNVIRQRLNLSAKRGGDITRPSSKQCPKCHAFYSDSSNFCSIDSSPLVKLNRSKSDELLGQILGTTYEILSVLGEGGNSRVYKARHIILERIVAIKVLHANQANDDTKIKRFLQESRAVSSLTHPNIVSLFDFGLTDDSRPYFCMDFIEGTSLLETIEKEGLLKPDRVVALFIQICDALAHAHKKGIIHRDIKPSNILLMQKEGGEVAKLVDFGIAKIIEKGQLESMQLTAEGMVCGSPIYMSPEQCTNQPLDFRTDVYSLGVSMYESLLGKPPFDGADIVDVITKQLREKAVPLRVANAEAKIPEALDGIVLRALNKSPDDRFQSMMEVKVALEAVYGEKTRRRATKEVSRPGKDGAIKILCVDDEEVSLIAYAMALGKNPDFSVVGVAINGELAVQRAESLKPDLVIMDFELPVFNGADATRMIKAQLPETKVLLMSSHSDKNTVLESFRAGENGYAVKSMPGERMFNMVRAVMQGILVIDEELDEQVAYEAREIAYETHIQRSKSLAFSKQEVEILKMLLADHPDEVMCEHLRIDQAALDLMKESIMRKLSALY
ncbi:MAG: protein kinase [Candidatus Obscuribacterales bacterium]|nr:protein kinase [Candidatus Obscuribacterales bacterium]